MNENETTPSEEKINSILHEITQNEDITNPKIETADGYKKGDGYMSFWTMVTLTGENKTVNLAIKSAPKKNEFRQVMPVRVAFLREIYFYEKVIPLFEKFESVFKSTPRCYKTVSEEYEELLVLENLKTSGFRLWNCRLPMDDAHLFLALKEYAKLHATSFGLRHHKPDEFKTVAGNMEEIFEVDMVEEFSKLVVKGADKIVTILREDAGLCEALETFKKSLPDFFKLLVNDKADGVIIHGDCWCNNIMFKYADSQTPNVPTSLKLIDYQLSGVANPVIDVAPFIYLSCDENVLNNLQIYLNFYHENLRQALKDMGCVPEEIYPMETLLSDWKLYGKFGLVMGCTEFYTMLRNDDELLSIDGMDKEKFSEMMEGNISDKEEADRRLCNLAKHMYKNRFI